MGFSADLDMTTGEGSSLSVNGGKTNLNADYKGVGEQSGLFTGDGGLDLTAGGKTTLIGGAITTTEAARDAGRNNYESLGGITTQDIENTTSYEGDAIQVGVSVGNTTGKPQAQMNGIGYGSDGDSDSSITKGGVSGYNDPQGIFTTENREALAGKLENNFDAGQVNEELGAQTQITQEFGKEAPKAVAEFSQNRINAIRANPNLSADEKMDAISKWDEGGIYRVAAHTALGALGTGSVEGALTTGGVAAAAPTLNDVQAKLAKALIDKGMSEDIANGTASGVVSLTLLGAGTAAGLDTSSTVTATNVDANNRQLHPQEKELAKVLFEKAKKQGWKRADGKSYTLQEIEDALRWANSTKYNEKYNDDVTIRVGNNAKGAAIDKVMYDSGVGADFESRLWKNTASTSKTTTFTQNFSNIKKPDANLAKFIQSQTKSYGYSWTGGVVQPYKGKTAGPTPGKPKPRGNQAQKVNQKELESRNQAVENGTDLRGGNSIQAVSGKKINETTGMVFEGGKWVYKSFYDATKHTMSQTTPKKLSNALDDQLGSMSYKGQQLSTESKKAVLEGLMTSAVLYPHVFGFEPDFVMTSGGVAGATQGVSGSSAVSLHNGQGYSSGNYDIGVNIDKSKIESFSVDGSVVYGFILDEPSNQEESRTDLTANTLQGSSFTGTSCYLGACGAIVTTRADSSAGIPSRKVLMLGLGQTLGKGGSTGGSISGGVMKPTEYNTIENIDRIKEQVRKIKPYR